jgi:hypothetical protein
VGDGGDPADHHEPHPEALEDLEDRDRIERNRTRVTRHGRIPAQALRALVNRRRSPVNVRVVATDLAIRSDGVIRIIRSI